MRYEGDVIRAPQLEAAIEGDRLVLLNKPRVGFGVWAVGLPPDLVLETVRLDEQLIIEGFDLPAGALTYGGRLYLRNTTPVVHPLGAIATVTYLKPDAKAPEVPENSTPTKAAKAR